MLPSVALGVGQFQICRPSSAFSATASTFAPSFQSRAVGDSHGAGGFSIPQPAASPASTLPWLLPCDGAGRVVRFSLALLRGVGQGCEDEDSIAAVRGPNVGRSDSRPFRIEPERGKITEDAIEASPFEGRDVFNKDTSRLNFTDDSSEVFPHSATGAVEPGSLACVGNVLAREAANDEIHQATKRLCVEGGAIRPNRRWIQIFFRHARSQDFAGVGFPLNVSDDSQIWASESDAKFEACPTGEERKSCEGRIHIQGTVTLTDAS